MRSKLVLSLIIASAWLVVSSRGQADTVQQRCQQVYLNMKSGVDEEKSGNYAQALQAFQEACADLEAIQRVDPTGVPNLTNRIESCKWSIQRLQAQMAASGSPSPGHPAAPVSTMPSTNLVANPRKPTTVYPWKTNIIAELFYIGEGPSVWTPAGSGTDDPNDRNGYAGAGHAATINPFYVALPFNDLTHPDKAKQYVPESWKQSVTDGKSVCQHHWVEIKIEDGSGHICYAQWEEVGPEGGDRAEYVFGSERPADNIPGIGVSPAVAAYLGFRDVKAPVKVRWRFIDENDVPPGIWLKMDEQAILYQAMHHAKDAANSKH